MKINETAAIIEKISFLYPSFIKDESKLREIIITWHEILEDYESEEILKNLKWHIKSSKFPPKISDLITQEEKRVQNIPNVEETKKFLCSNFVENPVTPEEMKEIMKKTLGEKWVREFEQRKQNK